MLINLEECHTGAVAQDILAHGMRFHPFAYIPEEYEHSILIEGLLAVPYVRVFGHNVLALKLLGFTSGAICLILTLVLVRMITGDERGRGALWETVLCFLFFAAAPPFFQFMSVHSLGNHNEGSMVSMSVLVAFGAWRLRPGTARGALLWFAAGLAVFWQQASVLPVVIVLLLSESRCRAMKLRHRDVVLFTVAFLLGYTPAIVVHVTRHFDDIKSILGKFTGGGMPGGAPFPPVTLMARQFWAASGENPFVCILAGATVGSALIRSFRSMSRKDPRADLFIALTACAVLYFLALTISSRREVPDAYQYLWVMIFPIAAIEATAFLRKLWAMRTPVARIGFSIGMLVVVLSLNFHARPSVTRLSELAADRGHAACFWRFSRGFAFEKSDRTPASIVRKCEVFGGDRAKECVSGIPNIYNDAPIVGVPQKYRAAFAFGAGEAALHRGYCKRFSGGLRRTCVTGYCVRRELYNRISVELGFRGFVLRSCSIDVDRIPFDGFEKYSFRK